MAGAVKFSTMGWFPALSITLISPAITLVSALKLTYLVGWWDTHKEATCLDCLTYAGGSVVSQVVWWKPMNQTIHSSTMVN